MKYLSLFFISCLFLFLVSCDCEYNYTYEVENQSSSTIKVKWQTFRLLDTTLYDSIEIMPKNSQTLFITNHGIEACRTGPFYSVIDYDLRDIRITKNDSIATKADYLENEQWFYEDGLYKAVVADSSF